MNAGKRSADHREYRQHVKPRARRACGGFVFDIAEQHYARGDEHADGKHRVRRGIGSLRRGLAGSDHRAVVDDRDVEQQIKQRIEQMQEQLFEKGMKFDFEFELKDGEVGFIIYTYGYKPDAA